MILLCKNENSNGRQFLLLKSFWARLRRVLVADFVNVPSIAEKTNKAATRDKNSAATVYKVWECEVQEGKNITMAAVNKNMK